MVERQAAPDVVSCAGKETRGWHAWADKMPPGPPSLHVIGEVKVGNPGIVAVLVPVSHVGIPETFQLGLRLFQRPGAWPEVETWVPARFDLNDFAGGHDAVAVYCDDTIIADFPIIDVE